MAPEPAQRSASPAPEREALAGLVERVTYHNPATGFGVLRVKLRGQRELVTVVGAAAISAGEFVQASGTWVNDRTHGLQFKAAFLRAAPPTTLEGIEKHLASGMIKGIGPVHAHKLVQAFAEAVLDTIEQDPERLREVAGIGPKRAERIQKGWAEPKVIRAIMLFLHRHGVGTSRAVRIFKTYGADAAQVISGNCQRRRNFGALPHFWCSSRQEDQGKAFKYSTFFDVMRRPDHEPAAGDKPAQNSVLSQPHRGSRTASLAPKVRESHSQEGSPLTCHMAILQFGTMILLGAARPLGRYPHRGSDSVPLRPFLQGLQ
jgi:hypothetical protein